MRLAKFVEGNLEPILAEWEGFARTLYPASKDMSPEALRDHAKQILAAVVADLGEEQTSAEQSEKSKGRAPEPTNTDETAAETHAVLRAKSGIDINQLAAEYRALRASVLRLWGEAHEPGPEALQEVIRFNEAIDQALAESIEVFSAQVQRAQNLMLGALGHDMRNPLNAILMTGLSLQEVGPEELKAGEVVSDAAATLIRCGTSIRELLDDLVDFNRASLGLGFKLEKREADLGALLADELKQHQAAHPERSIELSVGGDLIGRWDGRRLQQLLRNLISNAVAYGAKEEAVRVEVDGEGDKVRIQVTNRGAAIDASTAEQLFDPLRRGESGSTLSNREGLGLGLYIVREIAHAHGGQVEVRSDAKTTVFAATLPRQASHRRAEGTG